MHEWFGKEALTCGNVTIPRLIDVENNTLTTNVFVSSSTGLDAAVHEGLKRPFWGIFVKSQSLSQILSKEPHPFVSYKRFPNLLIKIGQYFDALKAHGVIEDEVLIYNYYNFLIN